MKRGVVLRSAWKIARSYWFSEEKWSAWGLLFIVINLNMGLVYITVQLNAWQGTFYEVIQHYNYAGFIEVIFQYAILAGLFIIIKGYQIYSRMLLHIHWRRWLTARYLSDWLGEKTYYKLQLMAGDLADNPDQRISEDIEMFVALTLRLSLDLLHDVVTVFCFVFILWNLSGIIYLLIGTTNIPIYGYLVWAGLTYAIIGTYWTVKLGRPLVSLDYDQQRYEADFRFSLVRVRENAESIAFYNGENQEKENCLKKFRHIVNNFAQLIIIRKRIMWLTTGYSQIAVIFAILMASPRYFSGQIHLGQMFQVVDAYNRVQTGFSFIIDSFTRLAQWRAVVNRLNGFLVYMEIVQVEATARGGCLKQHNKHEISLESISVFRPDGYGLITNITVSIQQGERLLVTGPSGCGKSTFLRALAGLWPYTSGRIAMPRDGRVMFVPQKCYMPIDQLRNVLLYPEVATIIDDTRLTKLLIACQLSHLAGKLKEVLNWGQVLSLGEQQRVAFIRVLLYKPDWLFLDEATSALDEGSEQVMYEMMFRLLTGTAIVSIGHRKTLLHYHRNRLDLDGKGGWRLVN